MLNDWSLLNQRNRRDHWCLRYRRGDHARRDRRGGDRSTDSHTHRAFAFADDRCRAEQRRTLVAVAATHVGTVEERGTPGTGDMATLPGVRAGERIALVDASDGFSDIVEFVDQRPWSSTRPTIRPMTRIVEMMINSADTRNPRSSGQSEATSIWSWHTL